MNSRGCCLVESEVCLYLLAISIDSLKSAFLCCHQQCQTAEEWGCLSTAWCMLHGNFHPGVVSSILLTCSKACDALYDQCSVFVSDWKWGNCDVWWQNQVWNYMFDLWPTQPAFAKGEAHCARQEPVHTWHCSIARAAAGWHGELSLHWADCSSSTAAGRL